MRLVLLSNSTNHGAGYLDHALPAITDLFRGCRRVAFVPFALADQAGYSARARRRLSDLGLQTDRVVEGEPGLRVLAEADGVFVGGGNTFRLLDRLQRSGMVAAIRSRVLGGVPYLGASAGTVIAAPTIKTTNDMPIVRPESFDALGLVPFQINCHYLDPDPASRHMGETRETRLGEYLEENDRPVVGLREGSWLEVGDPENGGRQGNPAPGAMPRVLLGGPLPARVFRRGAEAVECAPGSDLRPRLA
jgi:dipeptidase E